MTNFLKKRKNILFLSYYSLITICMTFPGLFDLANRIDPWIFGLPFAVFYLFVCIGLLCGGLLVQYYVEDRLGELDIEVEAADTSLKTETSLGKNKYTGGAVS
jgi:hypothetical protein